MRFLLLTIGTRGDVEPFCALTLELLRRGHVVDLFVESKWCFLARELDPKVSVHPLPFDNAAFFPATDPSPQLHNLVRIQRDLVWPAYEEIHRVAVAGQCRAVIANSFATYLVSYLAKALQIPAFFIHLQPLLPNQLFPSYRLSIDAFVDAIVHHFHDKNPRYCPDYQFELNPDLYLALLQDGVMKSQTTPQLTPFEWTEMEQILSGHHPQFTIVNAYNHSIIPPLHGTPGLGPNVVDVGSLADDYIAPSFQVPPDLTTFLQGNHKKPICIGFGSMPLRQAQVDMVLEVVRVLAVTEKHPVILVGDAFRSIQAQHWHRVFHLPSIPYPFLLPFCSLMVCHGGAGVLQAALHAGIPILACPMVGDQFALAALMEGLGFGRQLLWVKANRLSPAVSARDFVDRIHFLLESERIQGNCRCVTGQTAPTSVRPAARLAEIIEESIANYKP